MFSTNEEIEAINSYFKQFVLQHNDSFFDEVLDKTIKKITNQDKPDFRQNWENLIALMQIIERVYNLKSIITEDNYYRFEFHNNDNIQDKGVTKIEALYSCCYQTLKKYWNDNAPYFNRGAEPFDVSDFDNDTFNDEGFKENGIKEFLQTLTDNKLLSLYEVTKKYNPNKVKFLSWIEIELEKRKSK
jgi:CRISPR/Cas system CSM-associated protein Csm2 small subunit